MAVRVLGQRSMFLALVALLAAQEPTIRVPVRLVNLSTLVVSRDGRPVSGLDARSFTVLDNGRPQSVHVDEGAAPVSAVVAVQVNQDVRSYLPFIAHAGSVVESLLAGEGGDLAVIAYGDDVRAVRSLREIGSDGEKARMLDAGFAGISLLAKRPRSRSRILLFIGQPADAGSESDLDSLRRAAEREDVAVYALALPLAGRAFVSDTFSLNGPARGEGTGFRAGVDMKKLVEALSRSAAVKEGADPFTVLAAATGGAQLHFRTQKQLEGAIAAIGTQLRSGYVVSYYPSPADAGYHAVRVEVAVPGAKVYGRPGYWLGDGL